VLRFASFADWQGDVADWVAEGAAGGADLLVFPEYGAMALAGLTPGAERDPDLAVSAVSERMPAAWDHLGELARHHGVHVLAPSGPVGARGSAVNRAVLLTPEGGRAAQDKRILTPYERGEWGLGPGGAPLALIDTELGRVGVLICYDSEFPRLGRALVEAGAVAILVPSCTEGPRGRERVRIAARSRALEGQCVAALSMTTDDPEEPGWCEALGATTGRAGIYGPPDRGFPEDGVLAEGELDAPGWIVAEVDAAAIEALRRGGEVAGVAHWPEAEGAVVEPVRP
jgi:predicted amidohydrolase